MVLLYRLRRMICEKLKFLAYILVLIFNYSKFYLSSSYVKPMYLIINNSRLFLSYIHKM